ncbi:type I-E CRISPR-associated protein Cse2/CasB [Neptunomonas phycophila]|uniref:type I-E CRISPR-associated protein Cse2/CasB n=1 Tax=Neptunomonas phycophila TaxID=1572645 RepID=UPI0015BA57B6|nr:type I-E CRISPR-associated protein Cse2/CasB [Neptunomonas phycophila]QLE96560.1 type I-E CRISPR-associated protein Cse2/CasB [Neptunomonas phycophila]
MSDATLPDFMLMYQRYQGLKPGPKAELRRATDINDLIEIPAFYRLLQERKSMHKMKNLAYCLPYVKHKEGGDSLGQALAKAKVSEKRLFMVIRSESPNDLIQLRRLLKMAEPTVDWAKAAKLLFFWNELSKRRLLEDYFFYQYVPAQG